MKKKTGKKLNFTAQRMAEIVQQKLSAGNEKLVSSRDIELLKKQK